MLWLVIDEVYPQLRAAYVALFSNNSPSVGWVKHLESRGLLLAMKLVQSLALWLNKYGASPLTPLYIAGEQNAKTYIPSHLLGTNHSWFCENYTDLLNLFNNPPLLKRAFSDHLQPFQRSEYEGYFCAADEAFRNRRAPETQKFR